MGFGLEGLLQAPDWRTIIHFLVINYMADIFVLGGIIYLYQKTKQIVSKWRVKKEEKEENEEEIRNILEKLTQKDPEAVNKLINLIAEAVEERINSKIEREISERFTNVKSEVEKLKQLEDCTENKALQILVNALNKTVSHSPSVKENRDEQPELSYCQRRRNG